MPKVGCVLRLKPKRKRPTCNRNIARKKPRIKVGSMQHKLQKVRTQKGAIAVLKGYALIKKIIKGG